MKQQWVTNIWIGNEISGWKTTDWFGTRQQANGNEIIKAVTFAIKDC